MTAFRWPASRDSEWPGGAELPRKYAHTHDPFVTLSAVAATTATLRVGTAICLVVERDPITLAKEIASLDRVSGGRFTLGIGAGWMPVRVPVARLDGLGERITEPRARATDLGRPRPTVTMFGVRRARTPYPGTPRWASTPRCSSSPTPGPTRRRGYSTRSPRSPPRPRSRPPRPGSRPGRVAVPAGPGSPSAVINCTSWLRSHDPTAMVCRSAGLAAAADSVPSGA